MARKTTKPAPKPAPTAKELREHAASYVNYFMHDIEYRIKNANAEIKAFTDNLATNPDYAFRWQDKAKVAAYALPVYLEAKELVERRGMVVAEKYLRETVWREIDYTTMPNISEDNIARIIRNQTRAKLASDMNSALRHAEKLRLRADGLELGL